MLKFSSLTTLTALIVGSSAIVAIPNANAQNRPQGRFYCGQFKGDPATLARTSRGDIPVFIWKYIGFTNFDPQKRCDIVSQKFEQFYTQKRLDFLTTGTFNGLETVCVAQQNGQQCNQSDILFTLEPARVASGQITAQGEVEKLLKLRDGAIGPIERPSAGGQIWVDMKDFLRYAPTIADSTGTTIESVEPSSSNGSWDDFLK